MDRDFIGFGIAGNFANHLEQAGESKDFVDVVAKEGAPKGIFPTFIPNSDTFLGIFPFSSEEIDFIDDKDIQMEPEIALMCEMSYKDGEVESIEPKLFGAYNDCSIRIEGAKKISHKKNWGKNSKGVSKNFIKIDNFSKGGVMDNYSLSSYIRRDGELIEYGENSELLGYSYFYEELLEWIKEKLNSQKDEGPLEDLLSLIKSANYPKKMLISIGATRYTEFGENNYLKRGDELFVVTYSHDKYSKEEIENMIKEGDFSDNSISFLAHRVV